MLRDILRIFAAESRRYFSNSIMSRVVRCRLTRLVFHRNISGAAQGYCADYLRV